MRRARTAPLFPYTTLFRSEERREHLEREAERRQVAHERCELGDEAADRTLAGCDRGDPGCDVLGERLERRRVADLRSEEHTSELQSRENLVCRLLLEKKN